MGGREVTDLDFTEYSAALERLSCFASTFLCGRKTRAARNSILHLSGVQGSEDCANRQHSCSHNELPARF